MHPVLFDFTIPFTETRILIYSVFFSITFALMLGIYLGTKAAQKEGLPVQEALNMTFWGLICLILGARVYAFFENPNFYLHHPLRFFKLWEGSMATYGGAIGGVAGCMVYLVGKRLPVARFLDVYVPYGFMGLGIIRFGDFLNGTAFGKVSKLPWAVSFPKGSFAYQYHLNHGWIKSDALRSLPVHPSELYSSLGCLVAAGFLLWYKKRKVFDGQLFLTGGLFYVVVRFLLDFLRDDLQRTLPLGLSSTQWVGLILFLPLSAALLLLRTRTKKRAGLLDP
jgi:phosphatidylglycerol:prolipoprotein diacylglycerol transferase